MPVPGDQEGGDQEEISETEKFNNQIADNDFADKFYKHIINTVVMFSVLIILSIALFRGSPDLVDGIINTLNKAGECQKY